MNSKKLRLLLDKYYKGDTTLNEEEALRKYFVDNPMVNEGHILTIGIVEYDVLSVAEPDASAGLGVLYRVITNRKTTEGV